MDGELWQRPALGDNLGMADVRLVDLDVFKRYSLAIRQESAPAEELLAVLDATRLQVEAAGHASGRSARRRREAPTQPEPEPVADPVDDDVDGEAGDSWDAELAEDAWPDEMTDEEWAAEKSEDAER